MMRLLLKEMEIRVENLLQFSMGQKQGFTTYDDITRVTIVCIQNKLL